jgi:hypothetical protein
MTEVTLDNLSLPAADLLAVLRDAIHQIELYGACEIELAGLVMIELTTNEFENDGVGEIVIKY